MTYQRCQDAEEDRGALRRMCRPNWVYWGGGIEAGGYLVVWWVYEGWNKGSYKVVLFGGAYR